MVSYIWYRLAGRPRVFWVDLDQDGRFEVEGNHATNG